MHNYQIVKRGNLFYIQKRILYFFWWNVKLTRLAKITSFCYDIKEEYETFSYENLDEAKTILCEYRDLLNSKKPVIVEKYKI